MNFQQQPEHQKPFSDDGLNSMSFTGGPAVNRPQNLPPELLMREPQVLWDKFAALATLPRESGQEQHVQKWLKDLAAQYNWQVKEDKTGNLVLSVPGKGRGVDAEPVVIQAHMDMVCVKEPGKNHDFTKDPIKLTVTSDPKSGEILNAEGTTLGADNGIGLCAGLAAALSEDITDCPPLELLMTVDEERGLSGARLLDPSIVTGRRLLNLDTEESNCIYISCAGSRDMLSKWQLDREPAGADYVPLKLFLSGLPGGHSGSEIHEARGNSIKIMLSALGFCRDNQGLVAHLEGGSRRNVIPGTAEAVVWLPQSEVANVQTALSGTAFTGLLSSVDPAFGRANITVSELTREEAPEPIKGDIADKILDALNQLPHGVQEWSKAVPGLVETSNNVAQVTMSEKSCELQCMTRSSSPGAVDAFQTTCKLALQQSGASVSFEGESPSWEADINAELLKRASRVFAAETGITPEIKAIHAGLECGAFRKHFPDMEMISFGPDIREAHTVNEYIILDSMEPFWKSLKGLLKDLSELKQK